MHFGPDGKLYVAVGENANPANAQSLTTRSGKILRINPDGSIPADNPFDGARHDDRRRTGRSGAVGFRNPFTFAVQPGTGQIFVNDVGQTARARRSTCSRPGANYGWPADRGDFDRGRPPRTSPGRSSPTSTGRAPTSTGIAIAGGAFYNPPADAAAVPGRVRRRLLLRRLRQQLDPTAATRPPGPPTLRHAA